MCLGSVKLRFGNLGQTRLQLQQLSQHGEWIGLLDAGTLANMFAHDCEVAAEVIELLAPERKVKFQNDKEPILLATLLKDQAK